MKELIRKFTMGHPKQMAEPVIWYFLEGFTVGFPAVAVYFAINLFITYFNNPAIIFDKGYWNIALWLAGFHLHGQGFRLCVLPEPILFSAAK